MKKTWILLDTVFPVEKCLNVHGSLFELTNPAFVQKPLQDLKH